MTSWSVSIEAMPLARNDSLEESVDQLLSLLEDDSTIYGPVAFVNTDDQTFGARFSVNAASMQAAMDRAIVVFSRAANKLDFAFNLHGGSVVVEDPVIINQPEQIVASI
jgi:hypothetical protein